MIAGYLSGSSLLHRLPAGVKLIALALLSLLMLVLVSIFPFIGQLVASLIMPALSVGVLNACRAVDAGRKLAPVIVQNLVRVCRELARSGQTIVLIEQNIAATLALATRVYILNNGHIVHEGPAAELKKQPELLQRYSQTRPGSRRFLVRT